MQIDNAVDVHTCLKKLVIVSVAGLNPVRLHDSSPLVVLSSERLPMMLEFLRSDQEPFLSEQYKKTKKTNLKQIYKNATPPNTHIIHI